MKKKQKAEKPKEWNQDSKDYDEEDWDEISGDDEESGDEETVKQIRSYTEDEVKIKTVSATYKENPEEKDKRDLIIVKRAPDDKGMCQQMTLSADDLNYHITNH